MDQVAEQITALPIHWDKKGRLSVLMVTSRDTSRWVMPKGWVMDGKKPWRAAEIEALEEAGAEGHVAREAIGEYRYDKKRNDGDAIRCRVRVYPMVVTKLKRNWKERNERRRRWFRPKAAAKRVDEPELAALLCALANKPHKQPLISELRKAS